MPLNLEALPLEPDPTSVRKAREWVRRVLRLLHREELVTAAEVGVSELVTNAILHGSPPISVRVRGTKAHPRVEIRDGSARPPAVERRMTDEEQLLATFGRGLGLVAQHSAAWGAELTPDGKVVWFEPSAAPPEDADLTGQVFHLDQAAEQRLEGAAPAGPPIRVRLVGVPVPLYRRYRRRYYELARELRLLSLAHGADYPVARELTEVFVEAERARRLTQGWEVFDQLLDGDADRGDVELLVPAGAPAMLLRLLDTLERADVFCREQRLLTLSATAEEAALQRWFFPEFARQAAGEQPLPWPGVEDDAPGRAEHQAADRAERQAPGRAEPREPGGS